MALNYSFIGEWNAATKITVGNWVKQKLTVVQDGEAPEDLFLEYIIVMIGNGKRMQELSHELQDFIGEEKANDFANDLGFFLQSLPNPELVPLIATAAEAPIITPAVTVRATQKDILEGGLQSSRSSGSTTQKPMRLLENAIRSTTSTSAQKRIATEKFVDVNQRSIPQSTVPSSTVSASSGGLFTKRGSAKLSGVIMTSTSEKETASKKRRVIFDEVKGLRTQPQFLGNETPRNDPFLEVMHTERNGMFLGQHSSPDIGRNGHGNLNFPTMDPAFMYIEQMNMMAHRSGFASVEEMMFFQQNMMASMMGGGMGGGIMPMQVAPVMSIYREGPNISRPPAEPFAQHQARLLQQRGRGDGQIGGRGFAGRGRGRSNMRTASSSIDGTSPILPTPSAPTVPPPIHPTTMPTVVNQVPAVIAAVPPANTPVASETDGLLDSSLEYSGGRGHTNRGRGRGRGLTRGGFQGNDGRDTFGQIGAPFEGSGGRFAYGASRGRGSYRGRGRGAVDSGVAAIASQAAGPVSFNKVWVRQADIESPLVAGR